MIFTKRTAIIYSQEYLEHQTGLDHPESPSRLRFIMEGIRQRGLLDKDKNFALLEPRYASLEGLQLVHASDYINLVRRISESGGGYLNEETAVSRKSFDVARLAAGGAIDAAEGVISEEFQNAFVLARPPGHHATRDSALGFCIFNNIALAAATLLKNHGLRRVLILDIDAHHGNGTQEIFYNTNEVLYVSLHEDPTEFPGTGFLNEKGDKEGLGYNVNIPLPFGTGDTAYWKALKNIVIPIIRQYRPQFMLISAGFDGYFRDGIAELSLSAYIYPRIFNTILDLAHSLSEDRVVAVLEGGYRLGFLKKILPEIITQMARYNTRIHDPQPVLDSDTQKKAEKTIERARRVYSHFWTI